MMKNGTQKRKTRRQLLAEKEAAAKQLVDVANSVSDPLQPLKKFHTYVTKENETIELSCMKAKDATPECVSWVFDITERNMKTMYEQSDWGWDPVEKQTELTETGAWYLVATSNDKFLGYSHFRFDIDDREEVLYCYEIQLEVDARRKGLGLFIMSALETMASMNKMKKVVVTVFKYNLPAMQFFNSLGYKLDKTSPSPSGPQHYIIVSKAVDSGTVSNEKS